jgi:ABC-2 type transport system permease protein
MRKRIWALLVKEILAVWNDKKSRMLLIVPPILQLVIFAWAATLDVKNVPIGVLSKDHGEQSIELLQRFHGSPIFTEIVYLKDDSEVEPFIDNQRGLMVIHIDEQFSRNLDSHKVADVQFLLDGRRSNTTQILLGYALQIVEQFNQDRSLRIAAQPRLTQIVPRNWFNPNLLYYWYNVPCLCAILCLTTSLAVTSLSVSRERELGTFDQLLVSPMVPLEILIGKALPAILIGMAEGSLILFVAIYIFHVPFTGSLLVLYLSMFIFVSSIVGIGLFISSLCSTQQQAILGSFLFTSPAISLSGFATPIENMPIWLQYITAISPLRYFLIIVKGLFLKGLPFDVVMHNLWQMGLIAILTLSAAMWLFRKRIQ